MRSSSSRRSKASTPSAVSRNFKEPEAKAGRLRRQRRNWRVKARVDLGSCCLGAHGQAAMRLRHRQPGLGGGEAGLRRLGLPRHRGAAAVAALEVRPEIDAVGVLQLLVRHLGLGQAQLLALVQEGGAAQRGQQRDQQARQPRVGLGAAPAGRHALDVVVGEGPGRPAIGGRLLEGDQRGGDMRRVEGLVQQAEIIGGVQQVGLDVFRGPADRIVVADLGHRHLVRIAVHQRPQPAQEHQVLGLRLVVEMQLHVVGVVRPVVPGRRPVGRLARIVAQHAVVHVEIRGVQAEAVGAALQPELQRRQHRLLHLRVVQVQVGLLTRKLCM